MLPPHRRHASPRTTTPPTTVAATAATKSDATTPPLSSSSPPPSPLHHPSPHHHITTDAIPSSSPPSSLRTTIISQPPPKDARGVEVRLTVEIVGNVPMCGHYLGDGFCSFCNSEAGNSFVNDSNPNSFNDPPNVFNHPPQPQNESYLYELCGNDSHYGYDCPPRFPLYSINHQEDLNQQDVHDRWEELLNMIKSFCEKFLQQKQAANIDRSPPQEMSIQDMEDLKQHYLDEMLSLSNALQIKDYRNEKIDIRFRRECESMIDELKGRFNGMSIEINKKKRLQRLE
ncbi:hypothetical protein Tco_1017997 [Tanacetum coccineum]|uniref:BAG domain-containing protein n=1 Tax=Tanacetum coccineum TaxID=301880 RepID=A0ABQ5FVN8_9ASTR